MTGLVILKFIALTFSILFGTSVTINGLRGNFVHWIVLLWMAVSIALFIFLQWQLY